MSAVDACAATFAEHPDETCIRPKGHDGFHDSGFLTWERDRHALCCLRWAEVTEGTETRRKGPPWNRRTETQWNWLLKRPDPMMPFGFSVNASGSEWSKDAAVAAAQAKHDWWHDWDRRQSETTRVEFA